MAILDCSDVTDALESLLSRKLTGFIITTNEKKNTDPNICLGPGEGWIGIYMNTEDYAAHVIGNRPWLLDLEPFINIQVASLVSGRDASKRLQKAKEKVINVLETDRTIGNTVDMILGYSMDYEYNDAQEIYFNGVNVRIKCQVRS